MKALTWLHLDTKNLTLAGLAHIGKLVDLRNLDLIGENFDDDALQHLKPLRQLDWLGLGQSSVRGPGLTHLVETQSINRITLNWQKSGNEGLAAVSQFKRIETLELTGVTSITDAGLAHLSDMPRLRGLILASTSITDRGLEHLKSLPALERLELMDTNVTNVGMQYVAELPRLRDLYLANTRIGDAGLDFLKKTPVVVLYLEGTRITDDGLRSLKDFKQLEHLRIGESGFTDQGLQELSAIPRLRGLGLLGKRFGPVAWENVGKLISLEALGINDTNINDEGLAHLAGMTNLIELELHRTAVTDQGLMQLRNLPKLRGVACNDSPGVTPAGVQALLNALPSLRGQVAPTERDSAKRLLELGASIGVVVANVERRVDRLDDLPVEEFHVSNVYGGVYGKSNEALVEWNRLPHLKHLRLGQSGVSDADLRLIGECSELVELDVGECPAITDEGVAHLKPLKKLEHLDLLSTQLTDRGLEELRGLAGLRVLQISGTKITDAGMPTIGTLRELRGLHVSNTRITDAGLAKLVVLEHLESLGLHATETSDRGIDDILKFRDLTRVYLGSRVTDDGVKKLLAAPHLRKQLKGFDVSGNRQITDEICGALAECQAIHGLWLQETQISDAGLKQLSGLTTLGEIWLTGSKVTAAGVEDFRKARPQCGVVWDANSSATSAPVKE